MLLLAPTEIPSITIYLLGAVSVKALYPDRQKGGDTILREDCGREHKED